MFYISYWPPVVPPVVPLEEPDSLAGSQPFTLSQIPSTRCSPVVKEPPTKIHLPALLIIFPVFKNIRLKEAIQQ